MQSKLKYAVTIITAAALASGCVSNPDRGGARNQEQSGNSGECSMVLSAGAGALLGALVAKGNKRVKGALLGASAGAAACMAWNYWSKPTKSAAQVAEEYRTANRGALPMEATVTHYDSHINPPKYVSPGEMITITSDIELVAGRNAHAQPRVEEEVILMRPDGKETRTRKLVALDQGGGGMQTKHTIRMPEGIMQGVYGVLTTVYLDGQRVGTRQGTIQVI